MATDRDGAAAQVATLGEHKIKPDTEKDFCTLCLHTASAFGVGGCRAEFFTKERFGSAATPTPAPLPSGM